MRADRRAKKDFPSAYTIDFPRELWRAVKALVGQRGWTLREFLYYVVEKELRDADRSGELAASTEFPTVDRLEVEASQVRRDVLRMRRKLAKRDE